MIAERSKVLRLVAFGAVAVFVALGTVVRAAPSADSQVTEEPGQASDPVESRGPITAERATCFTAAAASGTEEVTFSDVTDEEGLTDAVTKDRWGHGVAWGDVNNDVVPDLLLGTFADYDPLNQLGYTTDRFKPDQLLIGEKNGFTVDAGFPETYGWTSGVAFADLDNDGYKDLVLSRNQEDLGWDQGAPGETIILRNDVAGPGSFTIVPGAIPPNDRNKVGGRSLAVLDYDADGLLDLFITQDRFEGAKSVLLRNTGGFRFVDATRSAGLPGDIEGFGVAAQDLTGDGHTDLYVVGSNRLFVANGDGTFREVDAEAAGLVRPEPQENRPVVDFDTGVSVGDVNRDDRPDIAVAHHYDSAASGREIAPVSLYLNRGLDGSGSPVFEDVTEASGLPSVASRAADVNINDFDNDGWPDIISGVAESETRPALFRHLGLEDGIPRFAVPDRVGEVKGTAEPGDQSHYGLPVATADYDRDGRLDVFYDYFFSNESGQFLLRNETESGHWVSVSVDGTLGGGLGARVAVYRAGGLGDPDELIGTREIVATDGYTAGVMHEAHFGLGEQDKVDVRVTLPPGSRHRVEDRVIELEDVPADRHLRLPYGCRGEGSAKRDNGRGGGWIDVTDVRLSDEQPLIGGREYDASITVTNSTARKAEVTARVEVPDDWESGTATRTLGPFASARLDVPITPGLAPSFATLTAEVTAETPRDVDLTGWPYLFGVTSVPPEGAVALGLDAGTGESPVLPGYRRLAPEDAWSEYRDYGWLNAPQAENREPEPLRNPSTRVGPQEIDPLQQDFAFLRRPETLRLTVPPGRHTVYMLSGDAHRPTANMAVSSDGRTLAESGGTSAAGVFTWTEFELDGGSSGRTVDLRFSAEADDRPTVRNRQWHLNGLMVMESREP